MEEKEDESQIMGGSDETEMGARIGSPDAESDPHLSQAAGRGSPEGRVSRIRPRSCGPPGDGEGLDWCRYEIKNRRGVIPAGEKCGKRSRRDAEIAEPAQVENLPMHAEYESLGHIMC